MNVKQQSYLNYFSPAVVTAVPQGASVGTSTYTTGTTIVLRTNYTDVFNNYTVNSLYLDTFVNLTPDTYTFVDGVVTKILSGVGYGVITGPGCKEFLMFDFGGSGNYYTEAVDGFSPGSLGAITDAVVQAALTAGGDLEYYNGLSYLTCAAQPGGIQRNPNCWAADFDFSGVAVTYLWGTHFNGGGALITRRHYVVSNHYQASQQIGTTLRFVGNDGSIHTRTVLKLTNGAGGSWGNPVWPGIGDVCVFLLSGPDLPESVVSYPVIGDWFPSVTPIRTTETLSYDDINYESAFITTNQFRQIKFCRCSSFNWNWSSESDLSRSIAGFPWTDTPGGRAVWIGWRRSSNFKEFESNAFTGDSGSPVFMPLPGNTMALYGVMLFPDSGSTLTASKLNAMILDVDSQEGISTGLTVTVAPDPTAP